MTLREPVSDDCKTRDILIVLKSFSRESLIWKKFWASTEDGISSTLAWGIWKKNFPILSKIFELKRENEVQKNFMTFFIANNNSLCIRWYFCEKILLWKMSKKLYFLRKIWIVVFSHRTSLSNFSQIGEDRVVGWHTWQRISYMYVNADMLFDCLSWEILVKKGYLTYWSNEATMNISNLHIKFKRVLDCQLSYQDSVLFMDVLKLEVLFWRYIPLWTRFIEDCFFLTVLFCRVFL